MQIISKFKKMFWCPRRSQKCTQFCICPLIWTPSCRFLSGKVRESCWHPMWSFWFHKVPYYTFEQLVKKFLKLNELDHSYRIPWTTRVRQNIRNFSEGLQYWIGLQRPNSITPVEIEMKSFSPDRPVAVVDLEIYLKRVSTLKFFSFFFSLVRMDLNSETDPIRLHQRIKCCKANVQCYELPRYRLQVAIIELYNGIVVNFTLAAPESKCHGGTCCRYLLAQ